MAQRKHVQGVSEKRDSVDEVALKRLRDRLRDFATARDWKQFHSPKNLCNRTQRRRLVKLLEHFQWVSDGDSLAPPASKLGEIKEEIADVLLYLIRLADILNVDLIRTANEKIDANSLKYPVEKSRGSAKKYTEL